MLATLLPGLREVRAPLASGFIWLVALWFLVEPRWPEGESAAVLASVNRLLDNFSVLGQGVAISFAAYILGSFSVFLFSNAIAARITTTTEHSGRLSGLSAAGQASLNQVARDGRQRIDDALALSGLQVTDVLEQTRPVESVQPEERRTPRLRLPRRPQKWNKRWWEFWFAEEELVLSGPSAPQSADSEAELQIAAGVLRDLPAVADAELLGQETEVFSAVDRNQAEVDFRIALIPAVVALGLSLTIALGPSGEFVLAAMTAIAGGLAGLALMLDAARRHRVANDLILSLMEHRRITPPVVSRAATRAAELADLAPGKVLNRNGESAVRSIHRYMEAVAIIGNSGVFVDIESARSAGDKAHVACATLERSMAQYSDRAPSRPVADDVLAHLDQCLTLLDSETERAPKFEVSPVDDQSAQTGAVTAELSVAEVNARLAALQREARSTLADYGQRIRTVAMVAAASDAARVTISSDIDA